MASISAEQKDKKAWYNELNSLRIEPKCKNEKELNNNEEELQRLADNIKQVYYQDSVQWKRRSGQMTL
jgi:hypothetical protein